MPIERSGSDSRSARSPDDPEAGPRRRARRPPGATAIRPRTSRPRSRKPSTRPAARPGFVPPRPGSSVRLTCTSTGAPGCVAGDLLAEPQAVDRLPQRDEMGDLADLVALELADEVPADVGRRRRRPWPSAPARSSRRGRASPAWTAATHRRGRVALRHGDETDGARRRRPRRRCGCAPARRWPDRRLRPVTRATRWWRSARCSWRARHEK